MCAKSVSCIASPTVKCSLCEIPLDGVQCRNRSTKLQSSQGVHQGCVIVLDQLRLMVQTEFRSNGCIEEIVQVNGWRCPTAKLEVNQHDAVRLTIRIVREHRVVHPDVTVNKSIKFTRNRVKCPSATFHKTGLKAFQFGCVALKRRPCGNQFGQGDQRCCIEYFES